MLVAWLLIHLADYLTNHRLALNECRNLWRYVKSVRCTITSRCVLMKRRAHRNIMYRITDTNTNKTSYTSNIVSGNWRFSYNFLCVTSAVWKRSYIPHWWALTQLTIVLLSAPNTLNIRHHNLNSCNTAVKQYWLLFLVSSCFWCATSIVQHGSHISYRYKSNQLTTVSFSEHNPLDAKHHSFNSCGTVAKQCWLYYF